jgi:hypothetical protein
MGLVEEKPWLSDEEEDDGNRYGECIPVAKDDAEYEW